MTDQQIIDRLMASPAVIDAHRYRDDDGNTHDLPTSALEARCAAAVSFAVMDALAEPMILRQLIRSRSKTLTDNYFIVDDDMGAIEEITIGDNAQPLEGFRSLKDYLDWNYDNKAEESSTDDPPSRFQMFDWDGDNRKVTIVPGAGTNTTCVVWYVPLYEAAQLTAALFPNDCLPFVYATALNYATGFRYEKQHQRAAQKLAQKMERTTSGTSPMPHSRGNLRWIRMQNAEIADTV